LINSLRLPSDFRDFLRHHPECEDVLAISSETQSAILVRNDWRKKASAEQVRKIFCRECCGLIVMRRAWGKFLARQFRDTVNQGLRIDRAIKLSFDKDTSYLRVQSLKK